MNFEEGERYDLDNLPESDMTQSGKLELVDDNRLAATYGDYCVTFKWASVECVDVTHIDDL